MSAIVWPLSRDPWKDLTNSHTVANTVWGTNSDLHLLPGLKPIRSKGSPRIRLSDAHPSGLAARPIDLQAGSQRPPRSDRLLRRTRRTDRQVADTRRLLDRP